MRVVLNVIWFVFAGLWMAIGYALAALIMFILVITIPFVVAAVRTGIFTLWPFGKTVLRRADAGAGSAISTIALIGADRVETGLAVRMRRLEKATAELSRARIRDRSLELPAPADLRDRWSSMSVDERRYEAIGRRGLRSRLAAELDLLLPPATARPKRRWTDAAIKHALDDLLTGRTTWPTYREFDEAGLGGLNHVLQSPAAETPGPRATGSHRNGEAGDRAITLPPQ